MFPHIIIFFGMNKNSLFNTGEEPHQEKGRAMDRYEKTQ
jgi:hypothetical protein